MNLQPTQHMFDVQGVAHYSFRGMWEFNVFGGEELEILRSMDLCLCGTG